MTLTKENFTLDEQISLIARDAQGFLHFLCSCITLSICKRCVMEYDMEDYKLRSAKEKVVWK